MNMLRLSVFVGSLCLAQGAASASLVLLHDNGEPLLRNGLISDPTFPLEIGDDFLVNQPSKVARVTWYGAYKGGDMLPDGPDHFSLRFFEFIGPTTPSPTPLADLFIPTVVRMPTSLTLVNGAPVFYYEADFPDVGLASGRHLISISNNTTGQSEQWVWHKHSSVFGDQAWQRFNFAPNWDGPYGSEMSFKIYAVPEPGVVSGVLVFGALLLRRRGRRA